MNAKLLELLTEFKIIGGVYHVYPRLKMVALNGWPRVSYDEAIKILTEAKVKRENRFQSNQ